jgi:hypothetical protein
MGTAEETILFDTPLTTMHPLAGDITNLDYFRAFDNSNPYDLIFFLIRHFPHTNTQKRSVFHHYNRHHHHGLAEA